MFQNESKSEQANRYKEVLQRDIDRRLQSAVDVIETVQGQVVNDAVVRGSALEFAAAESNQFGISMQLPALPNTSEGSVKALHSNAMQQIADRTGVPKRFVDSLASQGSWGASLLAHNFNKILHHGNGTKFLVRSVGDQARAFLSDRYRRLDSRPLIEAFASESQKLGLIPYEGYALDTTIRIRGIIPTIFEPYPGEFMAFGLQWKNSDFGVGGHELGYYAIRPACLNGMTRESVLRQVHLGARLSEDISFSQETYSLDTAANVSALRDIVRHALSPASIDAQIDTIRVAHEKNITPKDAKEFLAKRLTKGDGAEVIEAFTSPDIEMMPAGQTAWRLSNALSWVANIKRESGETEKALELQTVAGELVPKANLSTGVMLANNDLARKLSA